MSETDGPWACDFWVLQPRWDDRYPKPVRCPAIRWRFDEPCHNAENHVGEPGRQQ